MKRLGLIAFLAVAPLAAMAQFVVFTDSFNNGSTVNKTSVPGGTPFSSFTSYDVAASKAATTGTSISNNDFRIALNGSTSSGLLEVQALFSKAPITLVNNGDFINLTYTFRMTNALPTTSAYIAQGFYNSAGQPPVAGGLNNSGLSTTGGSPFANGNCAVWQGYYARIFTNAASSTFTRPVQNGGGTSSANQDLLGNNVSGGFTSPGPTDLGGDVTASPDLAPGQYYTISYTIVLTDSNAPTLMTTNVLYSGAGVNGANQLFIQTSTATGTTYLTNSFDGIAFGRRETGSILVTMDVTNITISENIAGLPGQPFDVTGGGTGCAGSSFPVGLDGSVTSNAYYLYTNGVWNGVVQTGTGSALSFPAELVLDVPLTNTVFASNTVSGITGFMIGSAVVAEEAPPVITSQPIPSVVANGSIGVFSLSATGGGLTYQWYKNGSALTDGGNISGSATPNLVISPAGSGDAGNYFCILTNGCGITADSNTNSLSIDTAANITWQGNNPNSNWDLSTTENFLNGTTPAVFNNGDNVTFSDAAAELTVNVTGNFIAPTLMTESANGSYIFNGPGVIQGPGSLVMAGPGSLAINNSNAWAGGTTIMGGSLVLSNINGVGPGTITLSNGTLDVPFKVGSAVGVSNNINLAASTTSMLQYEQNGTFACVLDGTLTGPSSATVNFNANNSGIPVTARVRLYSPFTNDANITLSTVFGAEIEFAPYNAGGNQVYNGLISGVGGHIVPRGTGNVILNGANTFNDSGANPPTGWSLLNSSGNVGIGADSVQSSPPTIDSSPVGTGEVAIQVGAEGGTCSFFASGAAHTIANQFVYVSTSNTVTVIFGGTNDLTLTGEFDLANAGDTNGTRRTLDVTNTGITTLAGQINDNSLSNSVPGTTTSSLIKTGGGALYLNGTNAYFGGTTNVGGLLAGSGVLVSPVSISNSASIGGGSAAAIGTLTVSNNLTLNGNAFIRVDKDLSPGQSNDVIFVSGTLASSGTGTVTVTNIGSGVLAVGDSFQIFNKAVSSGSALTVTGGGAGVVWNNNLGGNGTISVASIGPSGPTTNASITKVFLSGTNLIVQGTNNNVPNTSFHYVVLTTTNVATPLSNWTAGAATGFNPDGTFDYTNPIVPGAPRQFIDVKAVP